MTTSEFSDILRENGLQPTDVQLEKLATYAELLREWNAKVNLISRKDEENVLSRHILHSLALLMPLLMPHPLSNSKRIFDLGTGGGLPGLPLAIMLPATQFTLSDSINKKILAVTDMAARLELPNVRALWGRAEDLAKLPEHRQQYDRVVSRAVAPLDDLVKWTRFLIKPGARLYSLKGGDLTEEIARTQKIPSVREVHARPLDVHGYKEFLVDGKQLVEVGLS